MLFPEKFFQHFSDFELAKTFDAEIAPSFSPTNSACNSGREVLRISEPVRDTTNSLVLAENDEILGGEQVLDSFGAEAAFMDMHQLRPEVEYPEKRPQLGQMHHRGHHRLQKPESQKLD